MIGVIGPKDAVESLYQVATEVGRQHLILKGIYRSVGEAPEIANSLDSVCEVLLFTGRVPHRLATGAQELRAKLHYVPDGPIDLYRALALLSMDSPIRSRRFSLDTVSRVVIEEVFSDLGLDPPRHILPLDDIPGDWKGISAVLADFHRTKFQTGEVTECVTWLGQVFDELSAAGIPVRRVTHSYATYRETLLRAELADSAARSQASQVTAALVQPKGGQKGGQRGPLSQALRQFAERLQGTLVPSADGDGYLVYTTRGVLEAEISRLQSGFVDSLLPNDRVTWSVGYGVGSSALEAARLAERAVRSHSDGDRMHVLYSDGTALTVDTSGESRPVQLRIGSEQLESAHSGARLRPYSMDKVTAVIRQLDPHGFTAKQFGVAYGVQERSARRILRSLEAAGLASRAGIQTSPGAGRPNTVYIIDIEKLLSMGAVSHRSEEVLGL